MKATVTYNEDGEPSTIRVKEQYGHAVKFHMDGTTAVANTVEPAKGEPSVYLDAVHRLMDYAESLPFVQAVTLDDYEDIE